MRTTFLLLLILMSLGCRRKDLQRTDPELAKFTREKRSQAELLVRLSEVSMPKEGWELFDAILSDDWDTATNLFTRLAAKRTISSAAPARVPVLQRVVEAGKQYSENVGVYHPRPLAMNTAAWQPLSESYWAYVLSKTWNRKFLRMFADEIFKTVGTNSIYFGGSDAGRFAISALCNSQIHADPFFVLTQNQLADGTYLEYLRAMYTNGIVIPDESDWDSAYWRYSTNRTTNAVRSIMTMNSELVKVILQKNPNRDFFIEIANPVDELRNQLVPCGPVLRLNRKPLEKISETEMHRDRDFWQQCCNRLIGDWIVHDTPIDRLCEFVTQVYKMQNLKNFQGDPQYLLDKHAQVGFASLRVFAASIYMRRANDSKQEEQQRLSDSAMLALKQAFALGPYNGQAVGLLAEVLIYQEHYTDAELVLRTGLQFDSANSWLKEELNQAIMKQRKTN